MKYLRRTWQDIRRGENIDLYVLVAVAGVTAVLSMTDIVPSSWIAPLTLSVLALLSVVMLANRHRLDMISEGLTARVETLLPSFPSEQLRGDIEQAKVLTLFGADLHLTLMRNYAPLFDKLQGGDTVGVLLINPDSHACEMAANLHVQPMTCDDKRRTIRRSLKLCAELKNKTGGSIEVRLVDHLPAFGAFAMDQESPDGVLYFWAYTYKARDEARPKMILHPGDGYWYRFFCGEVRRIWEDAEPWQSSEAASGS